MRVNIHSDGRSVLARIVAILDVVAQDASKFGLSEIARRAGVKKPTMHQLATEMVRRGLLDRGTHGYRLGFHLFEPRLPETSSYVLAQSGRADLRGANLLASSVDPVRKENRRESARPQPG